MTGETVVETANAASAACETVACIAVPRPAGPTIVSGPIADVVAVKLSALYAVALALTRRYGLPPFDAAYWIWQYGIVGELA